ncbi:MAG: LapA family protein [Dongiaceae bacterium]
MKRAFYWIVLGPLFVIAILFAIGNVAPVPIGLWPLVGYIEAPLSFIALFFLAVGFLAGAIATWFASGRRRQRTRELADRNAELGRRIDELKRDQAALQARLAESSAAYPRIQGPQP